MGTRSEHARMARCVRAWGPHERTSMKTRCVRACVRAWALRVSGHGDPDPVHVCMETKRAWGPGASVRAWAPRVSRRGDPVRASVHGPCERAGVGTQCEQACMGLVRACMHGSSACMHACTGPVHACVRACIPCKCVRACVRTLQVRTCVDPAGTDMGVRGSGKGDVIVIPHPTCQ